MTHKSPKETPCLMAKGRCWSMISSTPLLAAVTRLHQLLDINISRLDNVPNLVSISEWAMMEPSVYQVKKKRAEMQKLGYVPAPPPL